MADNFLGASPALAFNGKEVRSVKELFIKSLVSTPLISQFLTVRENIVAKEQIGIFTPPSKLTAIDSGCSPTYTTASFPQTQKFWDPVMFSINDKQCLKDLNSSFFVYLQGKGVDNPNMLGTDIYGLYYDFLVEGAQLDLFKRIWFGDKSLTQLAPGTLTNASDYYVYNGIDGIWKQAMVIGTNNPARRIPIAANNGSGASPNMTQEFTSSDITAKTVTGIFGDMKRKADSTARSQDLFIMCTRSMADQYERELESVNVSESFKFIMSGISVYERGGIPIYAIDALDDSIKNDFKNTGSGSTAFGGVKYDLPHRAILFSKTNIIVGVDSMAATSDLTIGYNEEKKYNYAQASYKLDTKIIVDSQIQVAY